MYNIWDFNRSDWDIHVCLSGECKRKQISMPAFFDAWVDLRLAYQRFYGRRPKGLNGALQDVGLKFDGREHSGLCDARNTANLASAMTADGCTIAITKQASGTKIEARLKDHNLVTAAVRLGQGQ